MQYGGSIHHIYAFFSIIFAQTQVKLAKSNFKIGNFPHKTDSYDMIVEDPITERPRFTVSHLYESNLLRRTGMNSKRVKRLAQETVTLSTSLPLSFSSSVFLRTDTDRIDVMEVRPLNLPFFRLFRYKGGGSKRPK